VFTPIGNDNLALCVRLNFSTALHTIDAMAPKVRIIMLQVLVSNIKQRGHRVRGSMAADSSRIGAAAVMDKGPVVADRRRHSSPGGGGRAGSAAAAAASVMPFYPALPQPMALHAAPVEPRAELGSLTSAPAGASAAAVHKQLSRASTHRPALSTAAAGRCPVTGACRGSADQKSNPESPADQRMQQRQVLAAGPVDVDGCLHIDVLAAPLAPAGTGSSMAAAVAAAAATAVHGDDDSSAVAVAAAAVHTPRHNAVLVRID
jgi:hypothetical protein